jgi:hypothetical protein
MTCPTCHQPLLPSRTGRVCPLGHGRILPPAVRPRGRARLDLPEATVVERRRIGLGHLYTIAGLDGRWLRCGRYDRDNSGKWPADAVTARYCGNVVRFQRAD